MRGMLVFSVTPLCSPILSVTLTYLILSFCVSPSPVTITQWHEYKGNAYTMVQAGLLCLGQNEVVCVIQF